MRLHPRAYGSDFADAAAIAKCLQARSHCGSAFPTECIGRLENLTLRLSPYAPPCNWRLIFKSLKWSQFETDRDIIGMCARVSHAEEIKRAYLTFRLHSSPNGSQWISNLSDIRAMESTIQQYDMQKSRKL